MAKPKGKVTVEISHREFEALAAGISAHMSNWEGEEYSREVHEDLKAWERFKARYWAARDKEDA